MLFKKELLGKEIIDRDGNTLGVVEDVDINKKGQVKKFIIVPKGVIRILTRERKEIRMEDIANISEVIVLKKATDEPVKRTRKKTTRRTTKKKRKSGRK